MSNFALAVAAGIVLLLVVFIVRALSRSKGKESELDQKLMQLARVKDPKVICDGRQEYDGGSGKLSSIAKAISRDFGFVRRDYKSMLVRTIETLNSISLPIPDVIYVGLCNFDGETPFVRERNITGKWCALSLYSNESAIRFTMNIGFEDGHWVLTVPFDGVVEVGLTNEAETWRDSNNECQTHKYQTLSIIMRNVQFSSVCFAGHRCSEPYSALRSLLPRTTTFRTN